MPGALPSTSKQENKYSWVHVRGVGTLELAVVVKVGIENVINNVGIYPDLFI